MWLDEYIWNPGTPMLCHRFHSWELYPTFLLAAGTTHWCMFMNYGWAWPFCKGRPMEHNGVYSSFFPGANYVYRGIWASLWKVEQIDNTFFFVAGIGMLISWRSTLIFFFVIQCQGALRIHDYDITFFFCATDACWHSPLFAPSRRLHYGPRAHYMRSGVYPVLDHFGHYFLDDWPDHWKITCDHTGRLLDVELMSAFCTALNFPWQSCQYIKQAGTAKLGSQTESLFLFFSCVLLLATIFIF